VLVLKVREGGRTVNLHALNAGGVNADGYLEILGPHITRAEDCAGWPTSVTGRPRSNGSRAGDLERAPRHGCGHRRHPARRGLTALIPQDRRWRDVSLVYLHRLERALDA
jgi:hypothetical protein